MSPLKFVGVGVFWIENWEFSGSNVPGWRSRLTVLTTDRAAAAAPAPSVLPVKFPYDRQRLMENASAFSVPLPLKQTLPFTGFISGGMMRSGGGAPARSANACVAISTRWMPLGGFSGNL